MEATVIKTALDHLVVHLISDTLIVPPLEGFADLAIDVASDMAQRIDEQLHPERVPMPFDVQAGWLRFRAKLVDNGLLPPTPSAI